MVIFQWTFIVFFQHCENTVTHYYKSGLLSTLFSVCVCVSICVCVSAVQTLCLLLRAPLMCERNVQV